MPLKLNRTKIGKWTIYTDERLGVFTALAARRDEDGLVCRTPERTVDAVMHQLSDDEAEARAVEGVRHYIDLLEGRAI